MECIYCHETFSNQYGLTYHLDHHVCQKNKIICDQCHHLFKTKSGLRYHIDKKVCKKTLIDTNTDVNANTNEKNTIPINRPKIKIILKSKANYDQFAHRISQLENENRILVSENKILKEHPQTIKVTNKKDPFVQISNGEKFIYASKKKIISQLIENKRNILQEYVDNNGDKYGEKILSRYQRYIDYLDENKEEMKELELDIICMLLNVSEIIGGDEWSKQLLEDLRKFD